MQLLHGKQVKPIFMGRRAFSALLRVFASSYLFFLRTYKTTAPPSSSTAPAIMAGISHQSLSSPSLTLLLFGTLITMGDSAEVSFVISALRAVTGK